MRRSITSVRRAMKSGPVLLNHVSAETGLPQIYFSIAFCGLPVGSHDQKNKSVPISHKRGEIESAPLLIYDSYLV